MYNEKKGNDGRTKIIYEDNVAFDKGTFVNLFNDGACDTYIELPRMIKMVANDTVINCEEDCDKETLLYHLEGIKDIMMACQDSIVKLFAAGKKLGISDSELNPEESENIEIHLDTLLGQAQNIILFGDANANDNNPNKRF